MEGQPKELTRDYSDDELKAMARDITLIEQLSGYDKTTIYNGNPNLSIADRYFIRCEMNLQTLAYRRDQYRKKEQQLTAGTNQIK